MTVSAFIDELDGLVHSTLNRMSETAVANVPGPGISVVTLLTLALKNELEASEEAALWMVGERDVAVKLALARQCGDEAKHYRLIEDRLRELGSDVANADPLAQGYSPMFEYLKSLSTTAERLAAGPFTREALAKARNEIFIQYCEAQGDAATARLYRDVIQPDELFHHQLGRKLLPRFVESPADQELARRAAHKTLQLAEELAEMARLRKGICRAPGC